MHMFSKKDLNSAEMDTLTKSCSPYGSHKQPMEKCRTPEVATVYVKELGYTLDYESLREYASNLIARKDYAMKTDILTSGSTVKNHISLKTVLETNVSRRTSFRSWFLVCQRLLHPVLTLQHQ